MASSRLSCYPLAYGADPRRYANREAGRFRRVRVRNRRSLHCPRNRSEPPGSGDVSGAAGAGSQRSSPACCFPAQRCGAAWPRSRPSKRCTRVTTFEGRSGPMFSGSSRVRRRGCKSAKLLPRPQGALGLTTSGAASNRSSSCSMPLSRPRRSPNSTTCMWGRAKSRPARP